MPTPVPAPSTDVDSGHAVIAPIESSQWARAFEMYHRDLVRLATFLGGDARLAEDVVADVFCRVHSRLDGVNDVRSFLRAAVVNGMRDAHRRKLIRRRPLAEPPIIPDPVAESAIGSAEQRIIWDAVRGLPQRQRECILLRILDDLPEAEIAATLGISRTAVNTHLDRARTRLAVALEELR